MHKLPDVWDPADAVADNEHGHDDDGHSGQSHLQHRVNPFIRFYGAIQTSRVLQDGCFLGVGCSTKRPICNKVVKFTNFK